MKNTYVDILKEDGKRPINTKPELLTVKDDIWVSDDARIRNAYQEYQYIQDEADTADDSYAVETGIPQVPPNFGNALGIFDTDVTEVPWDADNPSDLQSDIAWGYVSPETSKSIWIKVYSRALAASAMGDMDEKGKFSMTTPALGITVTDPKYEKNAKVAEFLIVNAAFPKIQEVISVGAIYDAIHEPSVKPPEPIKKVKTPVGPDMKSAVGNSRFKKMKSLMNNRFTKWFTKKMTAFSVKFTAKKLALYASLQAAVVAAGLASAGTAIPYAQSTLGMIMAVVEVISNVVMALCILIAPALEQMFDGEGMCPPNYKALDKMIPVAANTIISTFIPIIGDIVDLFYPYACFRKPRDELIAGLVAFVTGSFPLAIVLFSVSLAKDQADKTPFVEMKKRLATQPYFYDSTLSLRFTNASTPKPLKIPYIDGDGVGQIPPELESIGRDWCNFANPIMLDRMGNFYYKYSFANKDLNDDGTVSFAYISEFYGVIASSELSCDVVCDLTTLTFDPVTGGRFKESKGVRSLRRFYFIKKNTDTQGYFTVTGCTNTDGCAPDADVKSSERDADYVISVPKVFNAVIKPTAGFNTQKFGGGVLTGIANMALGVGGGLAGSVVTEVAADDISAIANIAARYTDDTTGDITYIEKDDPTGKYKVKTINDYYRIDHGLVVEQAAGYMPEIDFCMNAQLSMDQCTDKRSLKLAIDLYELKWPNKRVKVVHVIEPRDADGCYYKFEIADFNPDTNEEDIVYRFDEVLAIFEIVNQSTCVFTLTDYMIEYANASAKYKKIREIPVPQEVLDIQRADPSNATIRIPTVKYPTRRPLLDSKGKPVIDASSNIVYVPLNPRQPFVVPSRFPKATTLGGTKLGALGACPTAACDNIGQINRLVTDFNAAHTNEKIQNVLKAWTPSPTTCQYKVDMARTLVDVSNNTYQIVQPMNVSFTVKESAEKCIFTRVSDTISVSDISNSSLNIQCPTATCDKAAQINRLIIDFNKVHADRKIQSVLKAWTPTGTRCDYLVEMLRVKDNKRVIQTESLRIDVKESDEKCLFTRVSDGSDKINSGTFIQTETPTLSDPDTSGGILSYIPIIANLQKFLNEKVKPIILNKPEIKLPAIASSVNKGIEELAQTVFNEQDLEACPNKSCRDIDILKAISTRYDSDNLPTDQFFTEKNSMGKLLKSGVANGSACDVIFQNIQLLYDDILMPPTNKKATGKVYRFNLTRTSDPCNGPAPYKVNVADYTDVSDNAIGVRNASTTLFDTADGQYAKTANIGYTVKTVPMNCRSDEVLANIKAKLQRVESSRSHDYKKVMWSFMPADNVCEYKVLKNITSGIGTAKTKVIPDVETFVKVEGSTVTEYDLADVDYDINNNTIINNKVVKLPFLAYYDDTKPSVLIDTTEKSFK